MHALRKFSLRAVIYLRILNIKKHASVNIVKHYNAIKFIIPMLPPQPYHNNIENQPPVYKLQLAILELYYLLKHQLWIYRRLNQLSHWEQQHQRARWLLDCMEQRSLIHSEDFVLLHYLNQHPISWITSQVIVYQLGSSNPEQLFYFQEEQVQANRLQRIWLEVEELRVIQS